MGKITDIVIQQKDKSRVSIFIDGEFSFGLGIRQLADEKLKIDQELDNEEIERLKNTSEIGKVYDLALRYLSIRLRSEREMRQYLIRKISGPDIQTAVLERLKNEGYLDDVKFASAWLSSRRQSKFRSKNIITQELRAKGVPKEAIASAFNSELHDEDQALQNLIEKKRRLTRYQDDQKLIQFLYRQGFSLDKIKHALKD